MTCGTGPEAESRLAAARQLHAERGRVRSNATPSVPKIRDGAFYLQTDDAITMGYQPFDLGGQSLVFTPAGNDAYTLDRTTLKYVEPIAEVRDFQTATGANWHYVARDLASPITIFGRSVSRIYVSAFNGIHLEPPVEQGGMYFDTLQTAIHRGAVLSPLMITVRKPRQLLYPRAYVDEAPGVLRVTWRSSGNAPFGYDLQADVRSNGRVTYSYRSVNAMRWGTPVLASGFDPVTIPRALLAAVDDNASDVSVEVPAAVRPMIDVRRGEAFRLRDSDLYAVRLQLGQAIDATKLGEGEALAYQVSLGSTVTLVEVSREGTRVPGGAASVRVDGDVVEIYGIQPDADRATERSFRIATYFRPLERTGDSVTLRVPFTPAPHPTSIDLSAASESTPLPLPIAEPFVLGVFDPYAVWNRLQPAYALSDYEVDGVVMYQTFFTDMIFWAGAYAIGSNPQVDGIGQSSPFYTTAAPRRPTLMHMNQLTYNYSATEANASKLLLHEFGHRWLYYFSIRENGQTTRALNPVTPHPAAYVHTAAAFPVYGAEESSAMGGGFFTPRGDGTYRAHAANMGYSWHDLYLMGLASPEEVQPWFYLAGTTLPKEYWPEEGAVASGERRDVQISQITDVHGPRVPSASLAQKKFKVLFVLVTEDGTEATEAEVAKLNEWRAVMERNFARATGGRATLTTTFVQPSKKRGVR
ncbi:MAG TPA: hypothetical protein VF883_04355 [Thermoanaerobaculia bacterium]